MPTDVTQSRGAEKCVGDRMGDGISVGMPKKARVIRNSDTSENERTCLVEAVRVVPETDPHRAHRIRPSVDPMELSQWGYSPPQARIAKQALCPPNPKELESATPTGRSTTPSRP